MRTHHLLDEPFDEPDDDEIDEDATAEAEELRDELRRAGLLAEDDSSATEDWQ